MYSSHRSRSRPTAASAIGAIAIALTLMAAGSASADAPDSGLAGDAPAARMSMLVDGRLYAAEQMSRFENKRLFMVAGRRDRARGYAVAFTKRSRWVDYIRRQEARRHAAPEARFSSSSSVTVFEQPLLLGDSVTLDEHEPNLANRRRGWFWRFTFDNVVSSVRTGDISVLLFEDTWYRGSMLYVRAQDSAELGQYGFDNVTSSVCMPRFPVYGCG
jgi:hypothetical protein